LICRFCSQWNPDGQLRCCFCSNRLDGPEDDTVDGRPDYAKNVRVTAPRPVQGGMLDDRVDAADLFSQLKGLGKEQLAGFALIVVGVIVLAIYFLRC
jgi:hypothetical protein